VEEMDKKTVKKKAPIVILYFVFVYLLAQYPMVGSADLLFLLVFVSYLAVLMFIIPWKKLEVKYG